MDALQRLHTAASLCEGTLGYVLGEREVRSLEDDMRARGE